MTRVRAVAAGLALLLLAACGSGAPARRSSGTSPGDTSSPPVSTAPASSPSSAPASSTPQSPPAAAFRITSPAFGNGGRIPPRYSCYSANQAPPLAWSGMPPGTAELALVLDDPDAVGGRYVHWIVVGIPARPAQTAPGRTPAGATVLPNSGGDARYLGPCPPSGTGVHHYRFTLYALRERLHLRPDTSATTSEAAIRRAALAQTRLVGRYGG